MNSATKIRHPLDCLPHARNQPTFSVAITVNHSMTGLNMRLRAFVDAKTSLAATRENLACLQGNLDSPETLAQLELTAEQLTEYAELFDALISRTTAPEIPDEP